MTAQPIRHNAQVPDRNGKIFYTSFTSLSHISKVLRIQTEGTQKRREAEAELGRIEGELKQKLLALRT